MPQIGFSHGVLYRVIDVYSKDAIKIYKQSGGNIIEVCISQAAGADKLQKLGSLKEFSRISIHLSTDIRYQDDAQTRRLLGKVAKFYNRVGAKLALVHPPIVEDWRVFERFKLNWAIENMDARNSSYKTVSDCEEFLAKHKKWKLVLDLNHCFSNDPSMKLAAAFVKKLKNKIAEIHLSGYAGYHEPLYKTKQLKILNFCKKLNKPIIIESTFDAVDEVEKEFRYIANNLKG